MIKSMTGYGCGSYRDKSITIEAETKAVNHRYLDIGIRLPKEFNSLEQGIKKLIKKRFFRGHFDIWVKVECADQNRQQLKLNSQLAKAYLDNFVKLQQELQLPGEISIDFLGNNPNLFTTLEEVKPEGDISPQLEQALKQALDSLELMRAEEGRAMYEEINQLAAQIKQILSRIEQRAPLLAGEYKTRLTQRINKLTDKLNVPEERLAQEVVVYAERSDISEELLRLDSHLNQLRGFLTAEGAIGKKLDFLIQEMNREVNTIGSKVSDVTISQQVVEIRYQLEKIREQIQNVE